MTQLHSNLKILLYIIYCTLFSEHISCIDLNIAGIYTWLNGPWKSLYSRVRAVKLQRNNSCFLDSVWNRPFHISFVSFGQFVGLRRQLKAKIIRWRKKETNETDNYARFQTVSKKQDTFLRIAVHTVSDGGYPKRFLQLNRNTLPRF